MSGGADWHDPFAEDPEARASASAAAPSARRAGASRRQSLGEKVGRRADRARRPARRARRHADRARSRRRQAPRPARRARPPSAPPAAGRRPGVAATASGGPSPALACAIRRIAGARSLFAACRRAGRLRRAKVIGALGGDDPAPVAKGPKPAPKTEDLADPRGPRPRPDRRRGQEGGAQGRLRARPATRLQGLRPEGVRRRGRRRTSRASCSRRPTSCRRRRTVEGPGRAPARGLRAQPRRGRPLLREVEEPDRLRRAQDRLDDRARGPGPRGAQARRRGDLQPARRPATRSGSTRRSATSSATTTSSSPSPSSPIRHPVQHPGQPGPAADADRQPGPRLDRGRRQPGEVRRLLLRGQARAPAASTSSPRPRTSSSRPRPSTRQALADAGRLADRVLSDARA